MINDQVLSKHTGIRELLPQVIVLVISHKQ